MSERLINNRHALQFVNYIDFILLVKKYHVGKPYAMCKSG
jgi:hypothetical protein